MIFTANGDLSEQVRSCPNLLQTYCDEHVLPKKYQSSAGLANRRMGSKLSPNWLEASQIQNFTCGTIHIKVGKKYTGIPHGFTWKAQNDASENVTLTTQSTKST